MWSTFDLPYGILVNVHGSEARSSKPNSQSKPVVSDKDRTLNTEAFILSFAVENSLPLLKVPKFLSTDINTLQYVKVDRTAATYKLINRRFIFPQP